MGGKLTSVLRELLGLFGKYFKGGAFLAAYW
jgi:hypothetical protein